MGSNLFKSEHTDIPVEARIARGREIASRSIDQDVEEKKFDVIALESVEIDYSTRLAQIGREVEALQSEQANLHGKRKDNRVRLRLLKQSIHEMEIDLLGDE
ncbi:hypothetical protein [Maritalea porphyrae]|uniref:hypothetical protein n=1 Tax=Maritalea porphyrae TaxID=880732 RepID=UPI0022B0799B|nr:hypothetical protein [Maritalea porphyrae]MCZ4270778.1 hypothetical protein [Maritalea porphyrae]